MKIFKQSLDFEWNKGNKNKIFFKHQVSDGECEEIFFDPNKKIAKDAFHSVNEDRHIIIGRTKLQRILFLVFTIRKNKVRVISARDLNKKERKLYD